MKTRSGVIRSLNGTQCFFTSYYSRGYFLAEWSNSAAIAVDHKYHNPASSIKTYSSNTNAKNAGEEMANSNEIKENMSCNKDDAQMESGENIEKKSPISTRAARFREELLRKIHPWEKITESWDTFPFYNNERTKSLLFESAASRLKCKQQLTKDYGGGLAYSSGRILLQSAPGTASYRYRLVRSLARELQVPLMVLTSNILPPCCVSGNPETSSSSSKTDTAEPSKKPECLLRKGDRVKYVGQSIYIEEHNRTLNTGQRGEVHEVNGDKIAAIFYLKGPKKTENNEKISETSAQQSLSWFDAKEIEYDCDAKIHDCYVAMEMLCEVLETQKPIILYFRDTFSWLPSTASQKTRDEFICKMKEMLCQLSRRVVSIYGLDKWEHGSRAIEKYPVSLRQLFPGFAPFKDNFAEEIFTNVLYIKPPEEEHLMKTFCENIEGDMRTVIRQDILTGMHELLKKHDLLCEDLWRISTDEMLLTKGKVEKIVAWATNHHLATCPVPCVKEDKLHLPHESLKLAILRLKEEETEPEKPSKCLKDLAENYEQAFVSAVVRPDEIGVKFDDVGALDDVKKVLNELVILPMKRPDLFSDGNLLRPCKGLLLFGPPGTGKTLIAKALATEAGANFINVTSADITTNKHREVEKLVKGLFSFADKLAPVIIFLNEVDSILGARGGPFEGEANRRLKNEFMSCWDGLNSKDSQRIIIIGATNKPFDLDDAAIRRMPRRIYVDLPGVENRSKILKVLLAKENLESDFSFEQLAEATDSYSGSDLKNLCVAAAYRPVEELLQEESKGDKVDGAPSLRPLKLDDFIHSKATVGPSVLYDSTGMIELREWAEQFHVPREKKSVKDLAMGEFECSFVSAVVCPDEIGVKFDDVGALDDVKKVLNELVILPMKRPELFSRGNLLRPCKGLLLFGPPGTGKTLIAKALATEAGANFINITSASITSKLYGEDEKYVRALFSLAAKLAPVIIFVDEVDSILGARGGDTEHEATRRIRNEFMASWDGLKSKDSQRIIIIGATNRPFDIDDAVIRRMPRRIYVDLPNVENRLKILKVLLAQENLESGFSFEQLAEATDSYSGSDLKNLCVAAAFRPVQELLQEERKGNKVDGAPSLRPLKLDDFVRSKAAVGPSVSYDATSMIELRKWNEQYGEGGSRSKSPFGF